jgi:hypothetical protein
MKRLHRILELTYSWHRPDGRKVKKKHIKRLNRYARNNIFEHILEGYQEGQFPKAFPSKDGEIFYLCIWKLVEVNNDE